MGFVSMKRIYLLAPLLVSALLPSSLRASSLASSISCIDAEGVPGTVVQTKTGKQVPIIYWKSQTFSGSGWTPERRCQEVSARFQNYHSSGTLEYITTGRMNGLPVICVAKTNGGACAGLLYTLKPGQNATATLKKLFDVRTKPGAAPLEETTARMYLSMDSIIRNKSGAVVAPMPSVAPSSTSPLPLF
ncbi:COP23 domain-containing protein [Synechococcus sp. AH-551-C10]|nr:COP23 domain-containing protein [Synechococcus sp. AH-551-C10]MDB4659839.1 COP23 domain-containing protein [Synechococcus sp. AH-551-C10]